MERSLAFFSQLIKRSVNPDSITGLNTIQTNVQYDIKKYDPNHVLKSQTSETKNATYNVIESLQQSGQFINYIGNSTISNDYKALPLDDYSDIKLSSIINWSNNYKSMVLKPAYFAYLKDFGIYPNNRLMILRRFNGPAYNDLFTTDISPINTMVSYIDMNNIGLSIKFNEIWDIKAKTNFMEVLEDIIGIKGNNLKDQGMGVGKVVTSVVDKTKNAFGINTSPLGNDILTKVAQKIGIITDGDPPYGDPNIINEAAIRNANGNELQTGLKSDITINFETKYIFREINGIDGRAEFLDIIANAINMGTSDSRFYLSGKYTDVLQKLIKDVSNGDIDKFISDIGDSLRTLMSDVINAFVNNDIQNTISNMLEKSGDDGATSSININLSSMLDKVKEAGAALVKQRVNRNRWKLYGAVASMSGVPTAPWHITIGNPKFPWFVIGNLVVTKVILEPGGEMSYNDMFTELTVKIELESGRSLGAQEIANLFNSAKGRIYATPEAIQKIEIPNNAQYSLPGKPVSSNTPSNNKNKETNKKIQPKVDTDKKNEVRNSTNYSNNVQGLPDNNLNPKIPMAAPTFSGGF